MVNQGSGSLTIMIINQLGPYINIIISFFMMLEEENLQPKTAHPPNFQYRFQDICL